MARVTDDEFAQLVARSWAEQRALGGFDGYSDERCKRLLPVFHALAATAHYANLRLDEIAARVISANR